MIWTITIPVEPTGQMRAKACIRGKHASVYKAKAQASRENAIMAHVAQHMPAVKFTGPLMLGVRCYLSIPSSKPKKWQEQARQGLVPPTAKPDLSNAIKNIEDCLTQMGVWEDDKLVVECHSAKHYSDRPRWEIEVRTWEPASIICDLAKTEQQARCA